MALANDNGLSTAEFGCWFVLQYYQQLEQARSDYNILQEDACAWDSNGAATGISCEQHFDTETPLE